MYPNVIFLMIDSFSSKKFHGKEKTSITPTLDKLVSEGTFFEQAISVVSIQNTPQGLHYTSKPIGVPL